jgi:formate dehydrogenase (NADP+) alpha subunit
MTNPVSDFAHSACIMAVGTNTTEAHPVISLSLKQAVRRGAKLIVIDPRHIELADLATLWLRPRPGSNVALLMGIARLILEAGLADEHFISTRCENFPAFRHSLGEFDLPRVAEISGVPAEDICKAARLYVENKPAAIVYAMGVCEQSFGTDGVMATANLAMLTGNVGKPGAGVNPLRGQNNVQGACDMGALPDVYPGYQKVTSPEARAKFLQAWGKVPPLGLGLTITEMMPAAAAGKLKALYLVGENPVLSDPDANHVRAALGRLDFFVVQDIFLTETAQLAHVVLPGASFAEKDGTFTNTERRVQRVRAAVTPPGQARPDWQITCLIAQKMGASGFDYKSPREILAELSSLAPIYGGISHECLENGGLQWPCPHPAHPGTARLHGERFSRGLGHFMPLTYRPPGELPDSEYPILLTTGRNLYQYHTGTMTRKVRSLNARLSEEHLDINSTDAIALGLATGDWARVASRRGEVRVKARVSDLTPPGMVYMNFHFAETPTNVLISNSADPQTRTPDYKVCAVRVTKEVADAR